MVTITGADGYVGAALQEYVPGARRVDIRSGADILDTEFGGTVIHLAAISGVEACEADPAEAARTNLLGTRRVATQANRVIFASTVGAARPTNIYTQTKRAGEAIVRDASDDYLICRLSNLYGFVEGVEKDVVLNRFVRRAQAGLPLQVHEPGTQRRDLIHADDVARHLADAAQSVETGRRTLASGKAYSVNELADMVAGHTVADIERVPNPRPGPVRSVDNQLGVATTHSVESFIESNL